MWPPQSTYKFVPTNFHRHSESGEPSQSSKAGSSGLSTVPPLSEKENGGASNSTVTSKINEKIFKLLFGSEATILNSRWASKLENKFTI